MSIINQYLLLSLSIPNKNEVFYNAETAETSNLWDKTSEKKLFSLT